MSCVGELIYLCLTLVIVETSAVCDYLCVSFVFLSGSLFQYLTLLGLIESFIRDPNNAGIKR